MRQNLEFHIEMLGNKAGVVKPLSMAKPQEVMEQPHATDGGRRLKVSSVLNVFGGVRM